MLKEYNEVIPNGAERLLKVFEEQSHHRMDMEKQIIPEEQRQSARGQHYGFIVALAFLIVSGTLIGLGHEISGATLGCVDLAALVYVFVAGKYYQAKSDNNDKVIEDNTQKSLEG